MQDLEHYVLEICSTAKSSQKKLKSLKASEKNSILLQLATQLVERRNFITEENKKDLLAGKEKGLSDAMLDRLLLDEKRIGALADSVRYIASLPDPVGEVVRGLSLPNGCELLTKRVPLGVVMVIYESRPNVTIDVGALCFKSGNACILKGGSEAIHSNLALAKIFQDVLQTNNIPAGVLSMIDKTERTIVPPFLKMDKYIDIVVPRGGSALIRFVAENSIIPVVKHDAGVCNLFVDQSADLDTTLAIVDNSKNQRPGVCNAAENLFIHSKYPHTQALLEKLEQRGTMLLLDASVDAKLHHAQQASEEDFAAEFLDHRLSVKTVADLQQGMEQIEKYSSGHTEVIISNDFESIHKFQQEINSAAVFVNCSSRFHDGGEFGLGAEVGISTGKLHVRGPMGLVHLTTTTTYLVGNGQTRA